MLSFSLEKVTETVTLNGTEVTVQPLPLYFADRVSAVWPEPPADEPESAPARILYFIKFRAAEAVEALGETDRITYTVASEDGHTATKRTGRPAWDDSASWPRYVNACAEALQTAGFNQTHIRAIRDALTRLEGRQLEAVAEAGNS